MSISFDSIGRLNCSPLENSEDFVTFGLINETHSNQWVHISCRFKGGDKLVGDIYSKDMNETSMTDMTGSNALLPSGRYKVIIGSEENNTFSGFSIKEFKVWNSYRSDHDVRSFRY